MKYIYFVRHLESAELLGAFSTKADAKTWAKDHSGFTRAELKLSKMPDGLGINGAKTEVTISWDNQS